MGVRGLSSFFDCNPTLSKDHKLHDCQVIIDGNNLVHFLYFNHKLDCIYGGDYYKFAEVIKKHISLYLACNIKPIIVLDGGYDVSDRKLRTVLQRTRQRLTNAQHIAKYGCCSGKVLPILAIEVMKSVLQSLDVTFVQSDYEADEEIMLLANRYKCPVISQDSDFYIFDISCGFIRLDSIENEIVQEIGEAQEEFQFLKCKMYRIDDFVSFFPGINKSVLPLFSTLIGNDFIHINTFDAFYSNIKFPKFKGKLKTSQRHKKMLGLLTWLQHRTVEEAVAQVLSHVKLKKRDQVRAQINDAMKSYYGQSCILLEDPESIEQMCLQSNFKTYQRKSLPQWFIKGLRCGRISPFLLNALSLHRNFLPSQVEDMSLESSFNCSRYIRQLIYSILLTYDANSDDDVSCGNYVDEYDRRNGNLQKESLLTTSNIEGFDVIPNLKDLNSLNIAFKMNIVLKVIGDDLEYFSTIPAKFQLLFGGTRYWLRNCHPKPPVEMLMALILTVILFGVAIPVALAGTGELTTTFSHDSDLDSLFKNVRQVDAVFFKDNMNKYCQKPQYNNANPIFLRHIHHFCQLQACLLFLTYLNKLLHDPFVNINLFECFNGSIFYNLTRELLTRSSSELFVANLLGRGSTLEILYVAMKDKILMNTPECCLMRKDSRVNMKSKKKKKLSRVQDFTVSEVTTRFELDSSFPADPDVDVFL